MCRPTSIAGADMIVMRISSVLHIVANELILTVVHLQNVLTFMSLLTLS